MILLVTALQINSTRAASVVVIDGITQTGSNNNISIGGTSFNSESDDAGIQGVIKGPLKLFDQLKNSTSTDIFVQIADRSEIIIEGDKNIFQLFDVVVENKTLILSTNKSYASNAALRIRIFTPKLSKLDLNGSGDVQLKSINGPTFEVSLTGVADIVAEGRVNKLTANIVGVGDIDFNRLHCQQCIVSLNGAAEVYLFAADSLKALIKGSGTIYVSGNPNRVIRNITGVGEILMQ